MTWHEWYAVVMKLQLQALFLLFITTLALASNAQEADTDAATPQQAAAENEEVQFIDAPVAFDPVSDAGPPPPSQPLDPETDPRFLERQQNIRSYNDAVLQLENSGGAWSEGLVEELASLGILQQQQSDHLAAIETFDRAVHVNRINSGLDTLEQIPLIEMMIDSYLALGDWGRADLYQNYLFYLQEKAWGNRDPRMIPVMERLASWNVHIFNIGYGDSPAIHISSAQMLLNTAFAIVDSYFGEDDQRYVDYLYGIANTAYLVAVNPDVLERTNRSDFRTSQEALRDSLGNRGPIYPGGIRTGEDALQAIAEHYAQIPGAEWELARVTADLGDWYLRFQRRSMAEQKYQEAWDLLAGLENGEELQARLFGKVQPIPGFVQNNSHLLEANVGASGNALDYDFIDLVLDVTENGLVRNIRLVNESVRASEEQVTRIRRLVRQSYFRPLVINGERVRSTDNYFRYRYWY